MSEPHTPQIKNQIRNLLDQKDLLRIIVAALTETIEKYTQTSVTPGKTFIKEKTAQEGIAIAGLIRLEGKEFSLELFLGFSKVLFLAMYENMFQMATDEINPENHDLAGEILNIAFGIMDPQFRELNYRLNSSFPKIYSGKDLEEILSKTTEQGIVVPFTTPDGKSFVVELYSTESIPVEWEYDPLPKSSV